MIDFPRDTHNPAFLTLLTIFNNQHKQDAENQKAHDEYLSSAANWVSENIQNRAIGKPLTELPKLTLMKIYNDDGTVTEKNFPDLSIPSLPPDVSTGNPGGFKPPVVPLDREDAILQLVNENHLMLTKLLNALNIQ